MNKSSFIICLIGCLLFFPLAGKSKGLLLNQDAGLNNIEVTAITKSQNGIMWVGTKKGLNRYDGYKFTSIHYFSKHYINSLLYDSERDVVWVGSTDGLYYINCKSNEVIRCTPSNTVNAVSNILQFQKKIVIGFDRRYILVIDKDFSARVVYLFDSTHKLSSNKMDIDEGGNIYLCHSPENRIVRISLRTGSVKTIVSYPSRIIEIISAVDGKIYTGAINRGFMSVAEGDSVSWYFDTLNKTGKDPEYVLKHGQSILVGYRNDTRLYEVDLKQKHIMDLTVNDRDLFNNKRIYCVYRDDYDVLWIGTSKGLIKLVVSKTRPVFEKLLFGAAKPVSTREIIEDEAGNIYVASYTGLFKYNRKKTTWSVWETMGSLGNKRAFLQRSMLDAGNQYIYLGSDANSFVRFDKRSGKAEPVNYISSDSTCTANGSILSMVQDVNGLIWLGTDAGLLSFDTITSRVTCHKNDKYSVSNLSVKYIHMLPGKRKFWIGGEQGMYLIDIDKGVLLHLDENTSPSLTNAHVNIITTDTKGNVWIGTDMGGINVLSADYKSVYAIQKSDGLSSNEVYHMLWQDEDRLWISTYNGLDYYHIPSKTIIQYHLEDGITNDEFNQNSALRTRDGKLYFGGIDGITAFYPPAINSQPKPFSVIVSGINIWDKNARAFRDVIPENGNKIYIQPGDNLLTFSFAGTDYTAPELNTYFYKIEGLHSDWISLGSQPTLRLESLKGGNYNLLVKAIRGSRGVASQNIIQYDLVVGQEFYRTIWFYILLGLALAGVIYVYFLYRLNTQKKLEILRVKIASNLHDEVGSLLTRITMSADRLITRMPRESETRDKLEGVSALSRAANVAMSDVLWTIDARNDFTGSLTDRMREHAEDLLLPRGIDVSIDFNNTDQFKKLSPEYRQHLFLLYKEIINNILKHSHAQTVEIVYKEHGEQCILRVRNDGVDTFNGDDSVSTGQGLRNIKMRAELLKGTANFTGGEDWFEVVVSV